MRVAIVWAFCPVTWDVLVAFLRVVCEYLAEYYLTNIYENATLMSSSALATVLLTTIFDFHT